MMFLCQLVISHQIKYSLHEQLAGWLQHEPVEVKPHKTYSKAVLARSSVRIDLAGGWSDTPPICFDYGGAVLNVAVLIDDKYPIQCVCRFVSSSSSSPIIDLKTFHLNSSGRMVLQDHVQCASDHDFYDVNNPHNPCVLLKACCIALELVQLPQQTNISAHQPCHSLSDRLHAKYQAGLEIAMVSNLPNGSGMGGSSVLAATILRAMSTVLQLDVTKDNLVALVSYVEQLMTTGGGWQDQVS